MTMIRINLIAERKAGTPKVAKKPTGQTSELQENLILIVSILLAVAVVMIMHHLVSEELKEKKAEERRLEAVWDEHKQWQDKKLEYEVQKKLLNQKIERISELKDRRQGPVKLMEDVANVLPQSVWLSSVSQGYDRELLAPTAAGREKHKIPTRSELKDDRIVRVEGYANSHEAITNFANQILSLDKRYNKTDLNKITRSDGNGPQEYKFILYFEIVDDKKPTPEPNTTGVN